MMCPLMYKSESFSYIPRNAPAGSLGDLQMSKHKLIVLTQTFQKMLRQKMSRLMGDLIVDLEGH